MTTRQRGRSGDEPLFDGEPRYEEVRDRIAADLVTLVIAGPVSTTRLVSDLFGQIQDALDRGSTFNDVAKAFERHGVGASADAVRVAVARERKRQDVGEPTPKQRRRRAGTGAPASEGPRTGHGRVSGASGPTAVAPFIEASKVAPDVSVARHLD